MAIINQVMVEVLNVAERGLELHHRQVQTTVAQSSPTTGASPSTTSVTTSPTSTRSSGGGGGGGGGPTSSPLLFFVALGFGVVFTNLWIIVGVKYCFRYNARNRAMRAAEDGDPINMENMPTRPHRRRREKKLMTMDEVNERFPLMKYKAWVASRAREGLSTSGGIAAAAGSRPATLRDADGVVMPSSPVDTKHSIEDRPATAASDRDSAEIKEAPTNAARGDVPSEPNPEKGASSQVEESAQLEQVETTATAIHKQTTSGSEEEEDDDDDHIHTAVPPELLSTPGDSCAICIDTLEDDEDIRGLACGHAFHAACIDPWLTSRRACCPLCKADYYIPKPRPEGEAAETERTGRRERRMNMPQQPPSSWPGIRGAPRLILPVRFSPAAVYGNESGGQNAPRGPSTRARREAREAAAALANQPTNDPVPQPTTATVTEETTTARRWRIGNPLGRIHFGRSRQTETPDEANPQPSPSQLEAGVR